jgi:hypothetical protein
MTVWVVEEGALQSFPMPAVPGGAAGCLDSAWQATVQGKMRFGSRIDLVLRQWNEDKTRPGET